MRAGTGKYKLGLKAGIYKLRARDKAGKYKCPGFKVLLTNYGLSGYLLTCSWIVKFKQNEDVNDAKHNPCKSVPSDC